MSGSRKRLERISLRYHNQFTDRENAGSEIVRAGKRYLEEHGICEQRIAEKYRLGVVLDPLPGDEQFTGSLCIPYLSRRGGVRTIKYRNLSGHGPKMQQYQGQQARPYNTNARFEAESVIGIDEGEIDAIAATERLGLPTVGVPGVETWGSYATVWKLLFKDFRTVFMLADGDPPQCRHSPAHPKGSCPDPIYRPGRELAKAVADSIGWRVRPIECPEGEDVSSMVASGRADWFADKLKVEDEDEDDDS